MNIMNKYAVGLVNFYDNELKMHLAEAESELTAVRLVFPVEGAKTLECVKEAAFNADHAIDVVKVD